VLTPQADTFGQSNNSGPYGSASALLVKYSDGPATGEYHRKAWFRFDMSSRTGRVLSDSTLALPLVNSYAGSTPTDAPWEFQVYGLTDESADLWDEATATWSNLPGNLVSSANGVDSAKTVSLGTFTVSGTGIGTKPTISGAALSSFLQNDANGLVTLIVVRNTQALDSTVSYVHAIGARESSTPATLSLVEANRLTNGEFEAASGSFSLAGWGNVASVASVHDSLVSGSTKAVFLDSSTNGRLEQTAAAPASEWTFDLFFATDNGNGTGDDRGLNLVLDQGSAQGSGQINLRVNGAGSVQIYQDGPGWQTLGGLGTVAFSEDANGDKDFVDVGDTLNVYHLRLLGHDYGTSTPTYDVLLSDADQPGLSHLMSGLSFFQFGRPTDNWNHTVRVVMETGYGTGNYAVDAAYLGALPEPATVSLAALGLLLLLGRVVGRRRGLLAFRRCFSLPGHASKRPPAS
jgi:hypothetical protein